MLLIALLLLQAPLQSPQLRESSGIATSRAHPGVFWSHNDSGDRPLLYATNLQGADLGRLLVSGAEAFDWEDMALGPCPLAFLVQPNPPRVYASTCVYLADTGDNLEVRPYVTLYAIPEPQPPRGPGDTLATSAAPAVLRVRYPDGPHDVEAVYVSPRDTAVYFVSKGARRGAAIRLYRADRRGWSRPDTGTRIVAAELIQTLDLRPDPEAGRVVTGAAVRPDGRVVVIRTYGEIFLYYPGPRGRLVIARERPCDISRLDSGGEAIDFVNDSTFVLTTEGSRRRPGTIRQVVCALNQGNQDR